MSNYEAIDALVASLNDRLKADAGLMALLDGIYNDVPQHSNYPYLVIEPVRVSMQDRALHAHMACRFNLAIYSDYSGDKEAFDITERLYALLHRQTWSLSHGMLLEAYIEESEITRIDAMVRAHRIALHCVLQAN